MNEPTNPEGLLVIDKPVGMTSFDVIRALWGPLGTRSLGHTGTLDPNATGVLCVCAGWALKLQRFLDDDFKVYRARVRLGERTDTDDAEGSVIDVRRVLVTSEALERALAGFTGVIEQVPPAFSAVKQGGERAYAKARRGERVALPPRPVRIDRIELESHDGPVVQLRVTCGKGTYIRSLARDLGEELGCGAHLAGLRRLASGPFAIEQAVPLAELVERVQSGEAAPFVRPLAMLAHLPLVQLTPTLLGYLSSGRSVGITPTEGVENEGQLVRIGDGAGRLVAIARLERGQGGDPTLRPIKVRP